MPLMMLVVLLLYLIAISTLMTPASPALDTFVYGGCSQLKYIPGSPYEANLNSLLTSLVNSAIAGTTYNNFTSDSASPSSSPQDTVYGVFQCRGDLSADQCSRCVSRSISQVGTLCSGACGGAWQLEGCFVKYDNSTFLGVEDKTEVVKKCGPPAGYDSDSLTRRDAVLGFIAAGGGDTPKAYRVGWSGNMEAYGQCVQDMTEGQCGDCLNEAIGRVKSECGAAKWGGVYLGKCYVRYSEGGDQSRSQPAGGRSSSGTGNNDNEIEKTLAILIGIIAAVALVIVFIYKSCEEAKGGGGK
ncbi:hypothetical protein MLD38_038026 [Melastoma candidum]|uniref:Uncharacterized protein n=1 Tax=Melastoma candidum TaxID=119954 RepID=A0ACB9KXX5_9MYRT|nr:hypothetical protein MLD38_038026 [Melastoma candidum]